MKKSAGKEAKSVIVSEAMLDAGCQNSSSHPYTCEMKSKVSFDCMIIVSSFVAVLAPISVSNTSLAFTLAGCDASRAHAGGEFTHK